MQWRGGEVLFRISSSSFWQVCTPTRVGWATTAKEGTDTRHNSSKLSFHYRFDPVGGHSFLYPDSSSARLSLQDDKLQIHCLLFPITSQRLLNKQQLQHHIISREVMQKRSEPIPIPREVEPNLKDGKSNAHAQEAKLYYDNATWRMYTLITAARFRAATDNLNYMAEDSLYRMLIQIEDSAVTTSNIPSSRPQQQRQVRAYSLPETPSPLMDGVFTMDSS
jgi:hypothetical protein